MLLSFGRVMGVPVLVTLILLQILVMELMLLVLIHH